MSRTPYSRLTLIAAALLATGLSPLSSFAGATLGKTGGTGSTVTLGGDDPARAEGPGVPTHAQEPEATNVGQSDGTVEYIDQPPHVWVVLVSDYIEDPVRSHSVEDLADWRDVRIVIDALNGGSTTAKVRFQGIDAHGGLQLEYDEIMSVGGRYSLVDPGLPRDEDLYGGIGHMPATFVVSSDQPVKLFGRVTTSKYFKNNKGTSSGESSRTLPIEKVDCDDPGNAWICTQWVRTHSWQAHISGY